MDKYQIKSYTYRKDLYYIVEKMLCGLFLEIVSASLPEKNVPTRRASYVHQSREPDHGARSVVQVRRETNIEEFLQLRALLAEHLCSWLTFQELLVFYKTNKTTRAAVQCFWGTEGNDAFDLSKYPPLETRDASYFASPHSILKCFRSIRIHCPEKRVLPSPAVPAAPAIIPTGPGMFGFLTMPLIAPIINIDFSRLRCSCSRDHEYWKEPARAEKLGQLVDRLPSLRELKSDGDSCSSLFMGFFGNGDPRIPDTVNDCLRSRKTQDWLEDQCQHFECHILPVQGSPYEIRLLNIDLRLENTALRLLALSSSEFSQMYNPDWQREQYEQEKREFRGTGFPNFEYWRQFRGLPVVHGPIDREPRA